jgi:hypothetical protein
MKLLENHNYSAINATIIADSKNEFGNRITTFVVTFPRIILAELNTHRMFSRNSASSRAIPFKTMVKKVQENPFIPIAWQKDHKGMQGNEYITNKDSLYEIEQDWLKARDSAVKRATRLNSGFPEFKGSTAQEEVPKYDQVTKQLCNRLLEPFMWHTAIITATEYENFFALRCPQYNLNPSKVFKGKIFRSKKESINTLKNNNYSNKTIEYCANQTTIEWLERNQGQGEIHIMALAEAMWDAMNESTPKELKAGEWHIPFGESLSEDLFEYFDNSNGNPDRLNENYINEQVEDSIIKIATARCARVSYLNFDGSDDYQKDIELHDNLAKFGHWSPFEHCAKAMGEDEIALHRLITPDNEITGISGNFRGFIQYRKMFDNENIT